MKLQSITCALFALALLAGHAQTQPLLGPPRPRQEFVVIDQPKQPEKAKDKDKEKDKIKDKDKDKKDLTAPPETAIFTQAIRTDFPSFFNPSMMGDWGTIYARQIVRVMSTQTVNITLNVNGGNTTTITNSFPQSRIVYVPVPTRGPFNIAENESPIPRDRVFAYWNSFSQLRPLGNNEPLTITNTVTIPPPPPSPVRNAFPVQGATVITATTVIPAVERVSLNREIIGVEKTFLDGFASIELRAPIVQQGAGNGGYGFDTFGDLTIVGKYALLMDQNTGNVFSTGLAITVPSSRSIQTTEGTFRDTYIQPFVGYLVNFDRFFVQGFSSFAIPTDSNDVAIAFNDIGVNYWLYRGDPNRFLHFVVPSFEVHVTTPLNHRNLDGPIYVPDTVTLTGGVHLGVGRNTTLTLGVATPITGPRLYSVETFLMLNVRF